jgi:hypothetical protein
VRCLTDTLPELTCFLRFPREHWHRIRHTDERFKAGVALSAGGDGVSLLGRAWSTPERRAGSWGWEPCRAACPLRAQPSRPSGGGHAPCSQFVIGAWSLAAWVASRRRAGGRRLRPAR